MSFKWVWIAVAIIIAIPVTAPQVEADDTGLASIHDLRRERGRLCQADHWHSGSGSGRTKRAAKRAAIGSWQSFTAMEYGSDWARFRRARSKAIRCSRTGRRSYDCTVEARPCR